MRQWGPKSTCSEPTVALLYGHTVWPYTLVQRWHLMIKLHNYVYSIDWDYNWKVAKRLRNILCSSRDDVPFQLKKAKRPYRNSCIYQLVSLSTPIQYGSRWIAPLRAKNISIIWLFGDGFYVAFSTNYPVKYVQLLQKWIFLSYILWWWWMELHSVFKFEISTCIRTHCPTFVRTHCVTIYTVY